MKILKNKKILLSIGIAIMVHSFANAQAVSANVNGVVTEMTSSDDRTYGLLAASTMGKDLALATRSSNGYFYPRLTAKYETGNIGIGTQHPTAKLMVNGIGGWTIDFQTTGRMKILSANAGTWLADQHNNDKAFYGYETTIPNHAFGIWTPRVGFSAFNILQNGNVGIGTESPTQKLEVNGGVKIQDDIFKPNNGSGITWGSNYSKIKDDGNLNILTDDVFYIGKCDGAGTRTASTIFADVRSGNVGIGTESPTAKLMVNGSGGQTVDFETTGRMRIVATHPGTWLADQYNTNKAFYGYNSFTLNHAFGIWTPIVGWSAFNILQNGNVGIGTESPTQKLEVNGGVKIQDDIFKPNNGSGITWGSNYSKIKDDGNLNILTDDVFYIGKCDGAGTRTATTIFADVRSGNVGIGTSNPKSKLQISVPAGNSANPDSNGIYVYNENNTSGNDAIITARVGGPSAGNPFISLDVNGESGWAVGVDNNDLNKFKISNSWASLTHRTNLTIDQTGNVGIGTTSPNSKLAVKGTVTALDFAIVAATSMPDYVFAKDYKLPTLSATEAYIKENKHLPAFKSAKEMEEKGYNVIDMDRNMLQTIEEMTLHAIAQEKTIATQEQKMNAQEAKLINLSQELAEIKALLQNKK